LYARYRDGEVKFNAYLDDYAFMLWAYLEMYEAEHKLNDLQQAIKIKNRLFKDFWDDKSGGFYFTSTDAESLIFREKQGFDGALPSGNSVAALQLWRLAKLTEDMDLQDKVDKLLASFEQDASVYPHGMLYMLQAAMAKYAGGKEVVISGVNDNTRKEFVTLYQSNYHPFDILMFADMEKLNTKELQVWKDKINEKHDFVLYVCEQYSCKKPIYTIEEAITFMNL